jgi:hypothetical protein
MRHHTSASLRLLINFTHANIFFQVELQIIDGVPIFIIEINPISYLLIENS